MINKPMLAATIESPDDLDKIRYPVYVSPKLDGYRCIIGPDEKPYTKRGEAFVNPVFNAMFKRPKHQWINLDGEVVVGDPTDPETFSKGGGWLRQKAPTGETPLVTFFVFDRVADLPFDYRWNKNKVPEGIFGNLQIKWVPQILCNNKAEVLQWEQKFVDAKYEGIIIRGALMGAGYKHGRATMKSQELMKYKRFADCEGTLIAIEEQKTNTNEKQRDALGHAKRSGAKDGKVGNGLAGTLIFDVPGYVEPARVGTGIGLTDDVRRDIWNNVESYIGRVATIQHQLGTDYQKMRFPSFKGWRDDGI